MYFSVVLVLLGAFQALAGHLPSNFPVCHRYAPGLESCLKSAISKVLPLLASGIPDLNFPPADPWYLESKALDLPHVGNKDGLGLRLSNITFHGLTSCQINDVKADLDNGQLQLLVTCPLIRIEGDYIMDAIIQQRSLKSQGRSALIFSNAHGLISPSGLTESRGGISYLSIDKTTLNVHALTKLNFNFDNLHPDPQRNADLNGYINTHIHELFEPLLPEWERQWSGYLNDLSRPIFSNVPLDEIFPDD